MGSEGRRPRGHNGLAPRGPCDILRNRNFASRPAITETRPAMNALADLIHAVFSIYIYVLIASALFSWLVAFNVVNTSNRFVFTLLRFLHRITEPALRPIRRIIPNSAGMDISPVILILIPLLRRDLIVETSSSDASTGSPDEGTVIQRRWAERAEQNPPLPVPLPPEGRRGNADGAVRSPSPPLGRRGRGEVGAFLRSGAGRGLDPVSRRWEQSLKPNGGRRRGWDTSVRSPVRPTHIPL